MLTLEVAKRGLSIPEISDTFSKNDFISDAAEKMGMTTQELIQYLWMNYNPSDIWIIYAGVAVLAVIFLWIYSRFILEK